MDRVKTLKDRDYYIKLKNGQKVPGYGVVYSQCSNSFQLYIPKEDYYIEMGSCLRGAVPEINEGSFVFDVASAPQTIEQLRDALIAVSTEKLKNDTHVINDMLKKVSEDKGVNFEEVVLEDFINKLDEEKKK